MIRTLAGLVAVLALVLGTPPPAQGEEPRRIRQRIDLDFVETPLSEAAAEIGRLAGKTILVDPDLEEQVTLRLHGVQWKQALSLVAERVKCEVQRRGPYLLLTRPKDRINIELYDANVRTALLLLARYADQSIVISPDIQGTITLRLQNVSAARAIRAVAKTAGDYVVVGEGGGPWRALAGEKAEPEAGGALERAPTKESVERVVAGIFRGLEEPRRGRPTLLLERVEDGATILERLRLAGDPVVRALQVRLLKKLDKGMRIAVGVQKGEKGWIATHLVGPTGTKKARRKTKKAPPKARPAKGVGK